MKRGLKGLVAGVFVATVGVGLGLSPLGARFEQGVGLAWLFKLRGAVEPPEEVVVVAMDSRTGGKLGLPPLPRDWPRSMHGHLVDELVARGASTIVFDVHFGRQKSREDDQLLVDAVERAGRVVLAELLTGKRQPISDQKGRHVGIIWAEELVPPFPGLVEAAAGLATFPLPKEGASVHQFWVFKESTDNAPTLPAVALQLYAREQTLAILANARAVASDASAALPAIDQAFSTADALRNFMRALRDIYDRTPDIAGALASTRPTGPVLSLEQALEALYAGDANRFLNFYGPPGTITTVPYHAVIRGGDPNVSDEVLDFSGKVVFVGYSDLFDPGQPDRFYTVYTREDGVDLSGVEIAATGFANLLTDRSLSPVTGWSSIALLAIFGLLVGLVGYAMPAYAGVPVAFVLAGVYGLAVQHAFNGPALLMPVATPLLVQAPLALFIGLLGQYLLERRRGQRISDAINYYLPDEIAHDLAQDRFDAAKINKVVYSACLATDMAGFSTVAEQLPPGELAAYLNEYFETLAAPLKRHGVHVTEFRADAIMCAWTADDSSPEPRYKAILAALEAGEAVKDFGQRHAMAETRLRIGLGAGWVYVGHAGGGGRFVYSIVGDPANTASRVEGLNEHLRTQILATGEVIEGLENVVTRYLGAFQFVGKTEAIPTYEVMALRERVTDRQTALRDAFNAAMGDYQQGAWPAAAEKLESLLADFPDDGPAEFLLARCRRVIRDPQSEPDPGVIRMEAK